ncbi:methyltransferase family protein [Winogradskyella psychrotolerans]|uniref:methyltransferase family protein n=1 Tax=Winogradskyella psychrotolerans TaxID=1344585 RepID=UPI002091DDD4|nr:methyltransferase [Winogradskyella psychrotolerans]
MKIGQPSKMNYVFVGLQLLLFVAYVFPLKIIVINLLVWIRYAALILAGLGLILGISALLQINTKLSPFPTPVVDSKLLTHGAYAIAKHPIYTSILTVTLGYAIYDESLFKFIIFIALWILFYFKSNYEEKLLSKKFTEYSAYKLNTNRFI